MYFGEKVGSERLSVQDTMASVSSFSLAPPQCRYPEICLHPISPLSVPRRLQLDTFPAAWRFPQPPPGGARAPGTVGTNTNGPLCPVGRAQGGSGCRAGAGSGSPAGGAGERGRRGRGGREPGRGSGTSLQTRGRSPRDLTTDHWRWEWGALQCAFLKSN